MLNVTLLTSVAKSALVGAVATKLVDTFISTKINNKIEQNKWLRNTKLELFSNLIDDMYLLNQENFDEKIVQIRRNIAKIILVLNDKKLSINLENYLERLNQLKSRNIENKSFYELNQKMITYLKTNIKI
jgi:ribosomal protein L29